MNTNQLAFSTPIKRNRAFHAQVKLKKEQLVAYAQQLPGTSTKGSLSYYDRWMSADTRYHVGVGKFGKEYYLTTIRHKDGSMGNNPNDMHPYIIKDGQEVVFDGSFDHVFRFFQEVSMKDDTALRLLGCLTYRNAFLEDHRDVNGVMTYCPPQDVVDYLNQSLGEYDNISIEAYLHYMEMIAWNEDTKYSTIGYDIHKGIGRTNNMLTYAHIIAILMGVGSFSKLCSNFSRPPIGMSPIPTGVAEKAFPELYIR